MDKNLKYLPFLVCIAEAVKLIGFHGGWTDAAGMALSGLLFWYLDTKVQEAKFKHLQDDLDKTMIGLDRRMLDVERKAEEVKLYVTSQALGKAMNPPGLRIKG